ncbi:MAG: hypothetical protein WA139_02440 [Candidatus Aenigmatarchaeota archaeon]
MPIPEKRTRFLQEIETQLKRRNVGTGDSSSDVKHIRNIITKGGAQDARYSGGPRNQQGLGGARNPVSEPAAEKIVPIKIKGSNSDDKAEEIFSCLNRLEERIDMLDAQMKRHFGNSKLVESEIGRLVSDKWESLSKETDECLTRMMGEMQDLRDIVIGLRSSVRSMEK